jgi:hypothetical protein
MIILFLENILSEHLEMCYLKKQDKNFSLEKPVLRIVMLGFLLLTAVAVNWIPSLASITFLE